MKDKAALYGSVTGLLIGCAFVAVLWTYTKADKNVPKNISKPVNEWACQPSPKLQKVADDNMLDLEIMVCGRDKPKE